MKAIECPWCGRITYIVEYHNDNDPCRCCGKSVNVSCLARRLSRKIFELTKIEVKPYIHRLYPGHWQRSEGAWVWSMESEDGVCDIGSQWAAKKVASARELSFLSYIGTIDIIVEKEK